MIEIYQKLFIGNQDDYESNVSRKMGWSVIHACKEPYHREELGYSGRSAPKNHPEYLIAKRENRLILNLIDAPNPDYIPKEIIDTAIYYIHEKLGENRYVLVHCNQGESRSPIIGLLYLASLTESAIGAEYIPAEQNFKSIYPAYNPGRGMREFAKKNFNFYKELNLKNIF